MPPPQHFALPNAKNTNMLVSLALGAAIFFAFYPTRNLKFALAPTPTPDASQWNIGGVGSLALGLCVGHVHFMFLCRFHLRRVANVNPFSGGIWALVFILWLSFY